MLKRYEGESENHFIWRVYKYRDDTGELSNVECGKICNDELGLNYDESRHRKKYEAFISIWSEVKDEYSRNKALSKRLEEIQDREDKLYKTKVKTLDQLREKRKLLRDEARIEALMEFAEYIASMQEPIEFKRYSTVKGGGKSAILSISDWHIGKVIKNYWNDFDQDIAVKRIELLANKVIDYAKLANVSDLYILNLGDLIEGHIRVTARVNAEFDALEQTMIASELIVKLLQTLHGSGLKLYYGCVLDNHSRLTPNYKDHIEKENFGKLINWHVKSRIRDSGITVLDNLIDDNIGLIEVNGKNIYYVHGHLDNPSSVIQDLSLSTGIKADYVFMAHYHKRYVDEKYFSKIFINGSLCGTDEFAKNKRLFSKASQSLMVINGNDEIDISINL